MNETIQRLLGSPKDFPVELTLSTGEKHMVPHPDYAHIHPNHRDLIIYPEEGPFSLVINPTQIVHVRPLRKNLF